MQIQCAHCQSSIVLEGKPPREVVCPSCGSSIEVDPDATARFVTADAPQRLGKFEILEQVGMGSFGAVYKARDTELGRLVALKIPRGGSLAKSEEMDRFLREAKSAAQLKHAGIVSLYDAGPIDGTCCLVSEFIQGSTLAERLSAKRFSGPRGFRQAAELIAKVAEALQYAHQHGVVHRDIKPSNIMLDLEGRPFLMDFGLAKRAADEITMTVEGQVLGTPAYMSPEQARGEVRQVDERSDIYSLGVVLYELLTGELPFRGQVRMLLVQVMQDEPRPPRRLNDQIPRDLETICLKAMAKEPARRYSSAREFAEDLERWRRGEAILARPPSLRYTAEKFVRRYRSPLALTVISLAVVIGVAVAAFVGIDRSRRAALAANEQLQEQLYDNRIAVAERELTQEQDIDLASDLLGDCPEKLRGWEWHYLMRLRDGGRPPLDEHQGGLWMASFNPDGTRIATASIDGTLKVWDAASGKVLRSIDADPDPVLPISLPGLSLSSLLSGLGISRRPITCVAYSPDGGQIASGSFSPKVDLGSGFLPRINLRESPGVVTLRDAATGQEKLKFREQIGVVLSLAYRPDGQQIASSSINQDNSFVVWDAKTGNVVKVVTGHASHAHRLRYSPDGRVLASSDTSGVVKLWNGETLELVRDIEAHPAPVIDVSFRPDGKRFATAGQDGTIRVWETATGQRLLELKGHTGSALGVTFSPDSQRIASAGFDKTVRLWDAETGKEKITLRGHTDTVWSVAFDREGKRLVSASFDNTARVWDASAREEQAGPGEPPATEGHADRVNSVAYSADGRFLASGSWDKDVRLWDAKSGQLIRTLRGHSGAVWGVAFSPDGERLASAGWDHKVRVWQTASGGEVVAFAGHTAPVHCVAFSPDGQHVASGGFDGNAKIWDAATGETIAQCDGFVFPIMAVAFDREGKRLATGGADRTVKLWDTKSGKNLLTIKEHGAAVHGVAFSPDGERLVSASWDHSLKVWNVGQAASDNRLLQTLTGHSDRVHGVAYSRSGTRILSVSDDKTLRTWDAESGREVLPRHRHRGSLWSVALSADDKRLAVACWSKSGWVKTWKGN